jgi:sugar phosphate isomerase/epimerase
MTISDDKARAVLSRIFIAVPYNRLVDEFLDTVLAVGANLELGLPAEALDRFSRTDFAEMARKLHDHGITSTLHAAFMDLAPASPDPLIRRVSQDRIKQVLDLVPLFQPRSVVCHSGYYPQLHGEIRNIWIDLSIEFWSSLAARLDNLDTILALENVFELDPDILKTVLCGVNSRSVRFCFDTGHTLAFSQTPWRTWLDVLQPYLGQIHIHDNRGKDDEHRALGGGVFPFAEMFSWLEEKSLKPIVTLEAHKEQWVWESLPRLADIWPWRDDLNTA